MTNDRRDLESFARAVEALEPFLGKVVFIGGWAHYLFTLLPEASSVPFELLRTKDADVATPSRMEGEERTIAQCLVQAGFRELLSGDRIPPTSEYVLGEEGDGFYLEFLTPLIGREIGTDTRGGTAAVGGVTAQTLRHLDILLESPWQVTLTEDVGFPVSQPRTISIPNPATSFRKCWSCQSVIRISRRRISFMSMTPSRSFPIASTGLPKNGRHFA